MPADKESKAVEIIKKYNPTALAPHVSSSIPIDAGRITESTLLYVTFDMNSSTGQQETVKKLVYFPFSGDPRIFEKSEDFISWYGANKSQPTGVLPKLVELSGGISGVIAVLIVAGFLWGFIKDPTGFKPPETLSNALSVVLGYFFGARATKR